jgi:hypothetical protein
MSLSELKICEFFAEKFQISDVIERSDMTEPLNLFYILRKMVRVSKRNEYFRKMPTERRVRLINKQEIGGL